MQTHNLQQGSSEWHEFRANHFGASEASVMLGISPHITRTDLLEFKKTGKIKEHNDFTKKIFQKGHEAEELARQILDDQGLDFYPVTCSLGRLSASCDGLTLDRSLAFEHKLYSKELADQVKLESIPEYYMAQCQQILIVTEADKLIFVCSDGTKTNWAETEVYPDLEWFERIKSGWKQFEADLATYQPREIAEKPEPAAIMQLPTLSVYTKGDIVVHGNLDAFKEASDNYIASINRDLKTDEDFVNAEATIKRCKEVEQTIKTAKLSIIGGISSVDEATRVLDYIDDSHAKIRLTLEKLVKSQKETIKKNIIDAAFMLCADHASNISREFLNINFINLVTFLSRQNFETACKGLRTLASLHNAVDTEVAAIKIKLDDLARVIRKNLTYLPEDLSLFRDLQSIITKPEDDFKLLVESRLAEQKRKEEEAAQRAVAEASERMIKLKEEESKRIESLPTDIKSVLADEKKQAELIVQVINKSPDQLTGFHKWWRDVGRNITGDRMFLAKSAWDAYKDESSK